MGGVPFSAVLDRHNASCVLSGEARERRWDPAFAHAILDLGLGIDLRGRGRDERSGAPVERLVRSFKASFFEGKRFVDLDDLQSRLDEWIREGNELEPARGTGVVPRARMPEERVRLRPLAHLQEDFALRLPVLVSPGAAVTYEGAAYPVPAEAAGRLVWLHIYPGRVRISGDGFDIEHVRGRRPDAPEFSE
jgi:hypothetical protein